MELYEQVIKEIDAIVDKENSDIRSYEASRCWKDGGVSELIMKRDAALELGGGGFPSANLTCVTSKEMDENQVVLIGPDLNELSGDVSFARVVILETDDLGEEEDAYNAIRSMEYVRYHIFPKGYMVRVSSESNQEQVRVSSKVVKAGISLFYVGNAYIRKYLAVPHVRHAKVIFVTDKEETVKQISALAGKADTITSALTHILDGLPTDCGHCSMKAVCDEVEGMKELHLGKKAKKN